jgi:hypothetical protein
MVVGQISNHLEWPVQVKVRRQLMESTSMLLLRVLISFEVTTEAQWVALESQSLCLVHLNML